jgi:glycosyltransferase involved in cell wall biosynthesis
MTSIAFIISGDEESAMGYRARALAESLSNRCQVHFAYRTGNKIAALLRFSSFLFRTRPQVTYVFDMSYSGVLAAWCHRLCFRNRLIIETGDAIYELMRSTGNRGPLGLRLTRWLEDFSLRVADRIVVRGRRHQQYLAEQGVSSDVIQDGVNTAQFRELNVDQLRQHLGLGETLTVGLVGSSIWSEKLGMCYGWELVELLRLMPDEPVTGIIIGDGSGIPHLEARCREYGIEDRVLFLGRVPYNQLAPYLNLIDVCLSTQTNDLVGQVRTSGKLPLYLATGRYVLASDVGEASLILPPEMLVPYDGVQDWSYPQKLAERVRAILADRSKLADGAGNVALAQEHFEYTTLGKRLEEIIDSETSGKRPEVSGTAAEAGAGSSGSR